MSFLKIVDNPLQDVEMTSIMYSIVGKFTLDELCYIKLYEDNKNKKMYDSIVQIKEDFESEENAQELSNIEKEILVKINNFLELLECFKNYSRVYSISEILVRLYKDTNIYYQFAIENLYESKKANLNLLIDIARDFEKNTDSSLSAYISYIDNVKYMSQGNSEAKILGENEDVVRIMTIHKSKGLEFPVVILADTNTNYMESDLSKEVIMHQMLGIGINVVNEEYGITYPSVIKQAIKKIGSKEIKSEELRMLYVALTRAKEKLVIFTTLDGYENFTNKQFVIYKDKKIDPCIIEKNKSYFQNINMALKRYNEVDKNDSKLFDVNVTKLEITDDFSEVVTENKNNKFNIKESINRLKEQVKTENVEAVETKLKENLDYKYKYLEDVEKQSRISVSSLKEEFLKSRQDDNILEYNNLFEEVEDKTTDDETVDMYDKYMPSCLKEDNKYTAVRKGILVHFILEHLDFSKINTKSDLQDVLVSFVKNGVISKEDAKYISVEKIYRFLTSNIGREAKDAKSLFREEEFVLKKDDINADFVQGVIDLYYINKNGNIVLIDFKTDKLENEQEFINRYKLQLELYKEALEKLTNKKVEKVYIYSFYLNKEIELVL